MIFDTETTGLPSKTLPPDDPGQARIMQIAMLMVEDGKEVGSFYTRLMPDNWPATHPKAFEAHGLSHIDCSRSGINQSVALQVFEEFYEAADKVVAHNLAFDSQLIDIELALQNKSCIYDWKDESKVACTMMLFTPLVKAKRANGQIKWPTLQETLNFCCPGQVIEKAHDALGDVRATAKVWSWFQANAVTLG